MSQLTNVPAGANGLDVGNHKEKQYKGVRFVSEKERLALSDSFSLFLVLENFTLGSVAAALGPAQQGSTAAGSACVATSMFQTDLILQKSL